MWEIAFGILLAIAIVLLWPLIWRLAMVAFFAFIAFGIFVVTFT